MKALFPYPTLFGDVSVVVVPEVVIDDQPVANRVDVDARSVDLHAIERVQWERARISIVVTAPATEIAEAEDAACVAVVNCRPSNNRSSVVLTPDKDTQGRWTGELELDRMYWYEQAEIRCGVVATVDDVANRVVGWAEPWTILFDDLPDRPINGALKITWVDFADPGDDKSYLRDHTDNYVYLSIDPSEPQLFLNRGFDGLEALLADRRRRHLDKALHDQTRASIADKVWTALFNAAIEAVEADADDRPELPDTAWQRSVLEALLARMYPDKSAEEALEEAWNSMRTPDSAGVVQQLLAPASAVQAKAPRLLRDGIRVLSAELGNPDEGDE